MNKKEIKTKLDGVLSRLGMDTTEWTDSVSYFRQKIEVLFESNNYNKLLKALFSSNDLNEFNSYVFEVLFAYDFQSKCQPLIYEVKQLPNNNSSVDFCYKLNARNTIYFELRLILQRNWITRSMESQLQNRNSYEIELGGNNERDDTARLQNLILSKCQNADGTPVKFRKPMKGILNFIAVNLSELHLGMIDNYDCLLAMYGDDSVPLYCRRGIFGMWQELQANAPNKDKEYYQKFQNFRETIHGILSVRYARNSGYMNRMYIDRELEYFAILNNNLLPRKESNLILEKLGSFLQEWSRQE